MDNAAETNRVSSLTSADEASTTDAGELHLDDPKSTELSAEFVGRWDNLISVTNWEKGKIIAQWREALMGSEAGASAYSDEAWSRRVGGVTPQHVGRLRRVHDRFDSAYSSYAGLYWSHFLAALDWDDAEMWLEGAVRSGWSVSQMRRTRWESMGADPGAVPDDADLVTPQQDEDYTPLAEVDDQTNKSDGTRNVAEGPRPDGPDFGDDQNFDANNVATSDDEEDQLPWNDEAGSQESPFAKLPSLPVDFSEAVEQFKLAIIRHRADQWADVDQADVLKALDALKIFASM